MKIRMAEDERLEVQMAPLIDCVFLLLIFFLVATTLKKIEKECLEYMKSWGDSGEIDMLNAMSELTIP